MKSYNIPQVLNEANEFLAPPRRPWVKPSVEMIALESAENGLNPTRVDGGGAHFVKPRS